MGSGTVHMIIRTSNAEGLSDTQVVTIIQLNTDDMFGMVGLPDAGYEAADQGDKMIQILSEIPWRLNLLPQNNPSNAPWPGYMLKLTDLTEHPPRPEVLVDYHFELFQNPNYTERVANVGVNSTAPGWEYITFPIKQKGTPPFIRITDPASKNIDFGDSSTPIDVKITTNANWMFSADGSYDDVILQTDSSANAEHYGTNIALQPVERIIRFTPRQHPFEILEAGKKVTTKVKFQTEGHSDLLPVSMDEIVISRTAKFHCEDIVYKYDKANNLLYVTAYTNADFRVVCEELKIDTLIDVDSYGEHVVTFPIPGYEVFEAKKYEFETTSATVKKDTTINKEAATLRFSGTDGFPAPDTYLTFPGYGVPEAYSKYFLNFTGTYTGDFDVRIMRTAKDGTVTPGTIVHGNTHQRKMNIAATDSWEERMLTFVYKEGITADLDWLQIFYPNAGKMVEFIQDGYSVNGSFDRDVLQPNPTTLRVHLKGFFPTIYAYAIIDNIATSKTLVPGIDPAVARAGGELIGTITIPNSVSWKDSRTIRVYVSDSVKHKTLHIADIQQLPLHLDTRSNIATVEWSGQSILFQFTGYHSDLTVVVDEQYTAAIKPDKTKIETGGDFTLLLDVLNNEGEKRTMKVYLKDETGVNRSELTITQYGENRLIVQRLRAGDEWPNRIGYSPIAYGNMTASEIALHLSYAGIQMKVGASYYLTNVQPDLQSHNNQFWVLTCVQKDVYTLGELTSTIPEEYFVILQAK
jgi:hypothetical protein